jgi:hypothetical protein
VGGATPAPMERARSISSSRYNEALQQAVGSPSAHWQLGRTDEQMLERRGQARRPLLSLDALAGTVWLETFLQRNWLRVLPAPAARAGKRSQLFPTNPERGIFRCTSHGARYD